MSGEVDSESERPDGNQEENTPANEKKTKINEGL
jgi:hypothetical protein